MKKWLIAGALVLAVAAAASAWAAIPGANGVINACYVKNIGLLRVIDEGKRCSQLEHTARLERAGRARHLRLPGREGDRKADNRR